MGRRGPRAAGCAGLSFRAGGAVFAPAMVTAGRSAVQAEQFLQPAPEAAAFRLASAGFLAESTTSPVAVVAPAPALVRTAAGAASLVSIVAHVCFCRREDWAPWDRPERTASGLGRWGGVVKPPNLSCPVSFYGSRLGLRDGWHQCEGPSRSLRSGKSDPRAVQETSRRTPFNQEIMPEAEEFTRNLKALSESGLGVRGLGLNHLGRADISPA